MSGKRRAPPSVGSAFAMPPPAPDRKKAKRARRDARFAMCYVDTPLEDDTHAYPAWFARPCTRDLVTALGLEKLMRRVHVKKAIPEQIEEYHDSDYIAALRAISSCDYKTCNDGVHEERQNVAGPGSSHRNPHSRANSNGLEEESSSAAFDCRKFRPYPVKTFPGCWNTSRVLVGASLTASRELRKMRRVPQPLVVNWIGGLGACAS